MATDTQAHREPSVTTLVTGIIRDTEDLVKQELALIKHEIRADLHRSKEAALEFTFGAVVVLLGGFLLTLMLVYLLYWATTELPLWVCYGIVGAVVTAIGGALLYLGKKDIDAIHPLNDQAAQALEETVQWKTNRNRR